MSPTNLGQLESRFGLPTGKVAVKRGQVAGGAVGVNNTIPPHALQDASGGAPMQISIPPQSRAGWWVIRAETIWMQADAVWSYWHWGVKLTPADADGWTEERNHMAAHPVVGWQESCLDTAFRLNAATAYTCQMWWPNVSGGYTHQYWTGAPFHYIAGEFMGEGAI